MNSDLAIEIGRDALVVLMLVSAPMLLLGMLVGVIMSIFQAATQIQEQTLAFVPKIIAVFVSKSHAIASDTTFLSVSCTIRASTLKFP